MNWLPTLAAVAALALADTPPALADNDVANVVRDAVHQARQAFDDQRSQLQYHRQELTDQLADVRHQVELARASAVNAVAAAQADLPDPPEAPEAPEFLTGMFNSIHDRTAESPLILPAQPMDEDRQSQITEDLSVMQRILTRSVESLDSPATQTALGVHLWLAAERGARQPIYVEGFGVIFPIDVRFPLAPPPATNETKPEPTPENSTWETTRRELYGEKSGPPTASAFGRAANDRSPALEYSDKRVKSLRQSLLDALRNASRIRNIQPADQIILAVQGTASGASRKSPPSRRNDTRNAFLRRYGMQNALVPSAAETPASLMIVRVQKQDADAFAKGELSAEQFGEKANIIVGEKANIIMR